MNVLGIIPLETNGFCTYYHIWILLFKFLFFILILLILNEREFNLFLEGL